MPTSDLRARSLALALAIAATACDATETGFDCPQTCADVLCAADNRSLYAVTVTSGSMPFVARLDRLIGGAEVADAELPIDIPGAGVMIGDRAVASVTRVDTLTSVALIADIFAGEDEVVVCHEGAEGDTSLLLDVVIEANQGADCRGDILAIAPPRTCDRDTVEP